MRENLMQVRTKFIKKIDEFIFEYTKKFREFENSPNLHEFRGEDKRLQ